jgi:hypothetical protein
MIIRLIAVSLFLGALVAPPKFRVRISLDAPHLPAERTRASTALYKGLFQDSLIIPGVDSMTTQYPLPTDSVAWANRTRTMIVRGSMTENGDSVDLVLGLYNILLQRVGPADTLRVTRASLDSAALEQGRRYARVLANMRR